MAILFLLSCFILSLCCGLIDFPYQSRANKLYVPANPQTKALFVMLHGCTQDPSDFYRGTNMSSLAEEHGFYVLYLQQPSSANMNKCWNWFEPTHQARGSGEPAFISGATKAVISQYGIDPRLVSVAGLSAGAAMSVIMGVTYPDVFCCVASAAGLEYQAATSMMTAFTAMSMGGPSPVTQGKVAWGVLESNWLNDPIQVVVFQGTSDYTVRPVNANQTVLQWVVTNDLGFGDNSRISTTPTRTVPGQVSGGYKYTTEYFDDTQTGIEIVKFVTIEGMGHAWSGGSTSGSYTDPKGPSMSQTIVDTFLTWGVSRESKISVSRDSVIV